MAASMSRISFIGKSLSQKPCSFCVFSTISMTTAITSLFLNVYHLEINNADYCNDSLNIDDEVLVLLKDMEADNNCCEKISMASGKLNVAHKQTHEINFRRTNAEIAKALRPKTNFLHFEFVDKQRASPLQKGTEMVKTESDVQAPRNYRFAMPEFLPRPNYAVRDRVLEKLERMDMLRRRAQINIPEFYVGSIMAVSVADPHAQNKRNRFVGICIDRGGYGLKAYFVLRNVIDGLGVEVMYQMYNPTLHSIEVLRLEKRLDDRLYYLRNCPLEYSTFSFDMEPVVLPRDAPVPVNTLKVKLNPKPWEYRWERFNLQGIEPIPLTPKMIKGIKKTEKPWEKYDLMKAYRRRTPEEEEDEIMSEVYKENKKIEAARKVGKATLRKRK